MADLTRSQAQTILKNLGWRVDTSARLNQAIKDFQAGWNLGSALAIDGKVGPATSAALRKSEANRKAGKPTASAHFSFLEVRCRCNGKYASCTRIFFKRSAFQMSERYRAKSGKPLEVVSGCRCPSHNTSVGGSSTSRHPKGLAMDVPARYSPQTVKSWKVATQIGYSPSLNKVCHIDMGPGYSLSNPRIFKDGK